MQFFLKFSKEVLCCFHTNMIQKFPFQRFLYERSRSPLALENMLYFVNINFGLVNHFLQLNLADASSLDQLREEFVDFQLSPADLTSLSTYGAADLTQKPMVGNFWSAVECINTLDGKSGFNTCASLCMGFFYKYLAQILIRRGISS